MLLCRELGSFLSRINRYAFISGGQHRKLRHWDIFIFYANLNLNDAQVKSAPERLACFSTSLPFSSFFSNRDHGFEAHNFVSTCVVIFHSAKRRRNVAFPYKIPLGNAASYVRFLFLEEGRDPLSITKLNLVRVNPPNTISENYVHRCAHFNVIIETLYFSISSSLSRLTCYTCCCCCCFVYFFLKNFQ